MEFTLNGRKIQYDGDENRPLIKVLREDHHVTTVKDGCSQGTCGACSVLVDGKQTLACVTPMKRIEGKSVITPDGLEQRAQEAFAAAFVEKGGIQCGYCTPGMVMAAAALLASNPSPAPADVRKAINRNICRCTGYKKIIESVLYAAEILRGEKPMPSLDAPAVGAIGACLNKYHAHDTVLGKTPFTGDIVMKNMAFGALKFSDHPKAKILSIDTSEAEKSEGVLRVFTREDIPGEQMIGTIKHDWPFMVGVGETTRCISDVLANVVAETEDLARAAAEKIKVEYEVLTPVTTWQEALADGAPQVHPDRKNLLNESFIRIGDVEKAFRESAYISEGTYETQRVEHAFLETEAAVATRDEQGKITVYSQGQGIFEDRHQICAILDMPSTDVNIVQVQSGGAFGGKEDLTVQGHAAMGAYFLHRPVRVELNREESIRMHPKRHPMTLKYKLGCDKNGKFTAIQATIIGDTGAYASVGDKVLERAAGHAAGAYFVPNVDVLNKTVYTNNIPNGAMRGFGVNQALFAMERCIDDLCRQGGFDRWQMRYDNALDIGLYATTGQILDTGVGIKECLRAVKDQFQAAKYAGIACAMKNSGVGNGKDDGAKVTLTIKDKDHLVIRHGLSEMGQGIHTMAIQFLCQETGLPPEIMQAESMTDGDMITGATTSSRGTVMIGLAIIDAARQLKEDLKTNALEDLTGRVYHGSYICDWSTYPFGEHPQQPVKTHLCYSYACQVVILDEETGKVSKVIAAHDVGRVINPKLFSGQVEGAVHMGLGHALSENLPMEGGFPLSFKYAKLGILRAQETPEIEVIGVEVPDANSPYGATGIGEIGMIPTPAAAANAIALFRNEDIHELPVPKR
ncbi:MAG: selenium-dependent xanthine dehydrogenase [Alphaproteobacteria bacterium]|jgi:aldehyde oxidoreductase